MAALWASPVANVACHNSACPQKYRELCGIQLCCSRQETVDLESFDPRITWMLGWVERQSLEHGIWLERCLKALDTIKVGNASNGDC